MITSKYLIDTREDYSDFLKRNRDECVCRAILTEVECSKEDYIDITAAWYTKEEAIRCASILKDVAGRTYRWGKIVWESTRRFRVTLMKYDEGMFSEGEVTDNYRSLLTFD